MWRHEPHIGTRGDELVGGGTVAECSDHWLTLRRTWPDRGPLDRDPPALEVDVVQLIPVDEPSSRDVTDLSVVLPAVPQPAQHLDIVGRLGEILAALLPHSRPGDCGP